MTAVESQSTHSPFMDPQTEASPARFTAVNGRETISTSSGINGRPSKHSEERPQVQPRITPPGQEKLTITTNTQREDWANGNHIQQVLPPLSQPESENSHKRKRSGSGGKPATESASSYHSHALPLPNSVQDAGISVDSPDTPYPETAREASIRAQPHSMARSSYTALQTPYSYPEEARENGGSNWYSPQSNDMRSASDNQHSSTSNHMSPEDHLREALQRENHGGDPQSAYPGMSPDDDGDHAGAYAGAYGAERTALQLQADHKKRKRNFSNRTKTGCMTCRRRKKKCDETRPECNNCIRGGFVCNGYPSRGVWPKIEQKLPPIPLQSKEGYDNSTNPYPQPTYNPHTQNTASGQPKREPLPGYRGQQLRVDPLQPPARSIGMDDDRPSASISSPESRISALSYSHTGPFPTPVSANPPSAYPDRLSQNDYKRMPPLLDPSRQEHDSGTPQSAQSHSPLPQISILHPTHTGSPHPHTPQSTTVQDAARLALSHPASATRPRTQKEEMLLGKHYFPFDRELVLERERCLAACWRFNNSTNPNNGVSPENRAVLFRDILQPKKDHLNISPTLATPVSPSGYVGNGVVVEAPFNCDYGYNIHIGQDVAIGKNCTILDTCDVRIGDRCVIGPNVNIYTATLPVDPKKRLGSRGPNLGKSIVIEEDCWIGGGVTILPGRTIKKGSTVGAGSIVTRDVPAFTVVCGNPARVMRGIYE